jgi:putative hydrolase of the HAD superfamily
MICRKQNNLFEKESVAMNIKAILWDFGGVITTSPFDSFNQFEQENDLPIDFIRGINAVNHKTNAWALLESNQISEDEFDTLFLEESSQAGYGIKGSQILPLISQTSVRKKMVSVLRECKLHFKNVCLTNNMRTGSGLAMSSNSEHEKDVDEVTSLFDIVIESSKVGIRKPDPAIYRLACDKMDIQPNHVVYLDDLGINLKPAREMGMITIKVLSEAQAIRDLEEVIGLTFN